MREASLGPGGDTWAGPSEQQQLVPPLGLTLETCPRSKCLEAEPPRPAGSESRHYAPAQGAQGLESVPNLTRSRTLGPEPGQTGAQGCTLPRKPACQNPQQGPEGLTLADEEPEPWGGGRGRGHVQGTCGKGKPVPKHMTMGHPQLQAGAQARRGPPGMLSRAGASSSRRAGSAGAGRYLATRHTSLLTHLAMRVFGHYVANPAFWGARWGEAGPPRPARGPPSPGPVQPGLCGAAGPAITAASAHTPMGLVFPFSETDFNSFPTTPWRRTAENRPGRPRPKASGLRVPRVGSAPPTRAAARGSPGGNFWARRPLQSPLGGRSPDPQDQDARGRPGEPLSLR